MRYRSQSKPKKYAPLSSPMKDSPEIVSHDSHDSHEILHHQRILLFLFLLLPLSPSTRRHYRKRFDIPRPRHPPSLIHFQYFTVLLVPLKLRAEINCGTPGPIYNGWIEHTEMGASLGASIIYRCFEGMKRFGASSATCDKNGRWSNPPPQCLCTPSIFVSFAHFRSHGNVT